MSAFHIDSHSSELRLAGNPSVLSTLPDNKQDGEATIAIIKDDLIDPTTERRLLRRLDFRIMPSILLLFVLNILARSNIGNARILNNDTGDSILQSLHMTDYQYLIMLMVFFIPYALFDTPSTYMLKYFTPPSWLAFLALGWGVTDMVIAASQNYGMLICLRLLLGAFEAGLTPGIIYYLTFWYRLEERAIRMAVVSASMALGGILSGFIAYAVGLHLNGVRGLEGWRWLFIIEGAPSCFLALGLFFFLPSYPENTSWLSPEDRDCAIRRLIRETCKSVGHIKLTWNGAKATLRDGRLYLHYLAYVANSINFSSLSLFSPTIVSGLGYEGLDAQLLTIPPLFLALVASLLVSRVADKYQTRSMLALVVMVFGGATFFIQGALPPTSFKARYAMLCIGTMVPYVCPPLLHAWLTGNLRDTDAMTLAIPVNTAIGALVGQLTGVFIYKSSEAPGYPTGHYTNGALMLVGALCIGTLQFIYSRRNMALNVGQNRWIV